MAQKRRTELGLPAATTRGVLLVLALVVAACQGSPGPIELPAPGADTSPVRSTEAATAIPGGAADDDQASAFAPTAALVDEVAPTQPAAATIRTELAATDPATVNLASGKPALVEFFAFW